jgi:hypothetical protein
MDAAPNLETADYTIAIKAVTGFQMQSVPVSYLFPGEVPVSQIAAQMAKDNDWAFVDGLKDDSVTISNYASREQSVVQQIRLITQMAPVDLYVENNRLHLKPRGWKSGSLPTLKIGANEIIGVPRPTQTGCKVKVRMNPWAQSGQSVEVTSLRYPELNSVKFYLDTLSHAGDTYGTDWFTELNLTKDGLGYYKNE